MDTVTILRDLWRHRVLVAAVAVLALLSGFAVLYKVPRLESRRYHVGVASTRILVDTPSSQVVEIAPRGSETLGTRANLLASLMVDGVVKSAIAQRAGIKPSQLYAVNTSDADSSTPAPDDRSVSKLTTRVVTDNDGAQLPIIEVDAQARSETAAARLANAAVTGLRGYLDSKAALQRIPDAQRLQLDGLGTPQAYTAARGPTRVYALVATLLVFALGCAGVLGALALVRGWVEAVELEQGFDYPLGETVEEPDQVGEETPPETETAAIDGSWGEAEWEQRLAAPRRRG